MGTVCGCIFKKHCYQCDLDLEVFSWLFFIVAGMSEQMKTMTYIQVTCGQCECVKGKVQQPKSFCQHIFFGLGVYLFNVFKLKYSWHVIY